MTDGGAQEWESWDDPASVHDRGYHQMSLRDLVDVLARMGLPSDLLRRGGSPDTDVPAQVASAYRVADGVDRARWAARFGQVPPHVLPSLTFLSEAEARDLRLELAARAAATGSSWQGTWWPVLVAGPGHVLCVDAATGRVWNVDWRVAVVEPVAPTLGTYWAACAYFLAAEAFDPATGEWEAAASGRDGPWHPVELGMDGPLPVVDVDDWRQHTVADAVELVLSIHRACGSGVVEAVRPPVTPADVDQAEALLGTALHPQLLDLYSIADGLAPGDPERYGRPRLLPWLRFPSLLEAAQVCVRSRRWTTERFGEGFWRPGWFPVLLAEDRGPAIHVDCTTTLGTAWRVMWNRDDVGAPRGGADWRRPVAPSLGAYLLWCGRRLEQMELFVDTDGQVRGAGYLDDVFGVDDHGFGSPGTW